MARLKELHRINSSVVVAKEGIITTTHRQTLVQAAFNFQINDHRELLHSFPSVTKKKCQITVIIFSGLEMPPRSPSAKRVQAFDGR